MDDDDRPDWRLDAALEQLPGKTVERIEYPPRMAARLIFTDGTILEVCGMYEHDAVAFEAHGMDGLAHLVDPEAMLGGA